MLQLRPGPLDHRFLQDQTLYVCKSLFVCVSVCVCMCVRETQCESVYLCKYAVFSVVLLKDMLESQLDLLLEFLHLYLLLKPGAVWEVETHNIHLCSLLTDHSR